MFNGFPTTITPAVKVWDYSKSTANQLQNPSNQIALTEDCAEFHLIYVGAGYYPVQLTMPASAPLGKQITIRVENLGGFVYAFGNGVHVYDSSIDSANNNSALQILAKLGYPTCVTFVYSPQAIQGKGSPGSQYTTSAWVPLYSTPSTTYAQDQSSRAYGLAFGENNVAWGFGSFAAGGSGNLASSSYAIALGSGSTASGIYSVAMGSSNTANASGSFCAGGVYSSTKSVVNSFVYGGNSLSTFLATAGSQKFSVVLGVKTTDATATILRSNTSAAGTTNQYIMNNNSASVVKGTIIANVTGAGNTAGWTFEAVIKRGANAAATSIVQSVVNLSGQDSGASGWTVAIAADTTNGGLRVTVTGQAATNISWVCLIEATEVSY